MNKILVSVIAIAVSATFATPVLAGIRDPKINQHQRQQRERIGQGVKSGELTRGETKDLAQDQRGIRQEERQDKSDGKFTKDERMDVRQDQAAASKEIYADKHNGETRP